MFSFLRVSVLTGTSSSWSYLRMLLMNCRCLFCSSSVTTSCSRSCSFSWAPASSSRSHWFSWHSLLTWARSFCFSASREPRCVDRAIIIWGNEFMEEKKRQTPSLTLTEYSSICTNKQKTQSLLLNDMHGHLVNLANVLHMLHSNYKDLWWNRHKRTSYQRCPNKVLSNFWTLEQYSKVNSNYGN